MTNQNIEILLSKGYECFKSKKFLEANKFFQKAYNLNNDYSNSNNNTNRR